MMAPIPEIEDLVGSVVCLWIDHQPAITGVLLGVTPYVYQLRCEDEHAYTFWAINRATVPAFGFATPK